MKLVQNVDEFNAIFKDVEDALAKLKTYKLKMANNAEIPLIKEDQYFSLVVVDKGVPSPDGSIHDFQ